MIDIVLDTNMVVSGLLWNGAPRRFFDLARNNSIRLITSVPLLTELYEVLQREKFAKRIRASQKTVDDWIDLYTDIAEVVRPASLSGIAPDPDDDVVIGTAIAGNAVLIVTGDQALLSVKSFKVIQIVSCEEALKELEPGKP